ncbi:MAG: GNAT family N-acetyltransferase [Thainema sp.]
MISESALLVGPEVFLRHPAIEDEAEFIQMVRSSRTLHRPWAYPPSTQQAFVEYIQRSESKRHESLLVCENRSGAIAGVINLNEIIRGAFQNAFLGYYAHADFAGRGYMTAGLQLALQYTFSILKLHRLEANIQPANQSSVRLVKHCGFRLEGMSPKYLCINGEWRDHERWAILADEWFAT